MTEPSLVKSLSIYRKFVSNLAIRELLLSNATSSVYSVGPSLIWVEVPTDLSLFTVSGLKHYLTFDAPHDNPRSPKYLKRMLLKNRMSKGSILIKEQTPENAPIKVHFCAYIIDANGIFYVFDPSWHSSDPGVYSTTAFYDSLDAFGIPYVHAEYERAHHWQSVLRNDVFCQTWTLEWLLADGSPDGFPLPMSRKEASDTLAEYITGIVEMIWEVRCHIIPLLPVAKWDSYIPDTVFSRILEYPNLETIIQTRFWIYHTFPTIPKKETTQCFFFLQTNTHNRTISGVGAYTVGKNSQSKSIHTFFHIISCSNCFSRSFIIGIYGKYWVWSNNTHNWYSVYV